MNSIFWLGFIFVRFCIVSVGPHVDALQRYVSFTPHGIFEFLNNFYRFIFLVCSNFEIDCRRSFIRLNLSLHLLVSLNIRLPVNKGLFVVDRNNNKMFFFPYYIMWSLKLPILFYRIGNIYPILFFILARSR